MQSLRYPTLFAEQSQLLFSAKVLGPQGIVAPLYPNIAPITAGHVAPLEFSRRFYACLARGQLARATVLAVNSGVWHETAPAADTLELRALLDSLWPLRARVLVTLEAAARGALSIENTGLSSAPPREQRWYAHTTSSVPRAAEGEMKLNATDGVGDSIGNGTGAASTAWAREVGGMLLGPWQPKAEALGGDEKFDEALLAPFARAALLLRFGCLNESQSSFVHPDSGEVFFAGKHCLRPQFLLACRVFALVTARADGKAPWGSVLDRELGAWAAMQAAVQRVLQDAQQAAALATDTRSAGPKCSYPHVGLGLVLKRIFAGATRGQVQAEFPFLTSVEADLSNAFALWTHVRALVDTCRDAGERLVWTEAHALLERALETFRASEVPSAQQASDTRATISTAPSTRAEGPAQIERKEIFKAQAFQLGDTHSLDDFPPLA